MKKILFISFSCCILFSLIAKAQRIETLLEKNWKFTKGEVAEAMKPEFDDRKWETVTVPHDWAIFGPFDRSNDLQERRTSKRRLLSRPDVQVDSLT